MKTSKMLELVENLKVGERVIIEKFKDHLFIEKKLGNRIPSEWIPAPSDNICRKCGYEKITPTGKVKYSDPQQLEYKCENCGWLFDFLMDNSNVNANGVDLSILNDEDWFYVETGKGNEPWIAQSNILEVNKDHPKHYSIDDNIMFNDGFLCDNDEITLLRKATPEDLAPFFEKYPMYAPVEVGNIGIFYDDLRLEKGLISKGDFNIYSLESISNNKVYPYENRRCNWKHFFKVSEHETIAEIRERFLKEVGDDKDK